MDNFECVPFLILSNVGFEIMDSILICGILLYSVRSFVKYGIDDNK